VSAAVVRLESPDGKNDTPVALPGSLSLHLREGDVIAVTGGRVTVISQERYDELLARERHSRVNEETRRR
jgi:hypothetical protein